MVCVVLATPVITPDAKHELSERSDGTFAGLIVPLLNARGKKAVTRNDIRDYHCTYPNDWEERVYGPHFSNYTYRKSILAALSLMRQANVTAFDFLLVDVAARLVSSDLLGWRKIRVRRALSDVRDWVTPSGTGTFSCPDAYTAGRATELKPDFARAYSYLAKALLRLNRSDEALQAAKRAIELDPSVTGGPIMGSD